MLSYLTARLYCHPAMQHTSTTSYSLLGFHTTYMHYILKNMQYESTLEIV